MNSITSNSTFFSVVVTQAIAIVVFVVVPVLVTLMVPRTTIQLRRENGVASAYIIRHALLVVPAGKTTIAPLRNAESIVTGEKQIKEDRVRRRKATTQLATGLVEISGDAKNYHVQSTYEDAPRQAAQINAFIQDPSARSLAVTAAAPWKLTYVLGGVLSGLAALYCAGAVIESAKFLLNLLLAGRGSR